MSNENLNDIIVKIVKYVSVIHFFNKFVSFQNFTCKVVSLEIKRHIWTHVISWCCPGKHVVRALFV